MTFNFDDFVNELYPDLAKEFDSLQQKLAKKIIKLKLELNLNQIEMAYFMHVSLNQYLDMEMGETNISIEEYEKAIQMIETQKGTVDKEKLVSIEDTIRDYPQYSFEIEETNSIAFSSNNKIFPNDQQSAVTSTLNNSNIIPSTLEFVKKITLKNSLDSQCNLNLTA